jgi:hypothetical protein
LWVFYCQPWEQEGGEYFATCSPEVVSVVALAEQLTPGSKVSLKTLNSKTAYFLLKCYVCLCPKIRVVDLGRTKKYVLAAFSHSPGTPEQEYAFKNVF